MGFFSDIISDAQRPSMATFRNRVEPETARSGENSFVDPVADVTETLPQQQAGAVRAAPQPDKAHEVRNLDGAAQPPAMPETGSDTQDAGIPEHGVLAEPEVSTTMVPLATEHERIGAHLEPRHLEAHIDPEHKGFLRPALTQPPAAAQPSPAHGTGNGADLAVKAGDGRLAQERRKVAMLQQAENADLQLVAPQSADAGVEAGIGVAVSNEATAAMPLQDVAENAPPAQQEVMAASVVSRPVVSAPVAIDHTPVRRPGPGQAAATNAGPQVHIGHIDIVVLAPEQVRPLQPPVSASADLASRHYLRRL